MDDQQAIRVRSLSKEEVEKLERKAGYAIYCGARPFSMFMELSDPTANADETYTVAADIWSLGQIVASLECGLPEYENGWETDAVAFYERLHIGFGACLLNAQ